MKWARAWCVGGAVLLLLGGFRLPLLGIAGLACIGIGMGHARLIGLDEARAPSDQSDVNALAREIADKATGEAEPTA